MIFETHAHYDDEKFDEDRAELLSSMQENGIGRIINVSANLESLENTRKLMEAYPFIYGAFGLHPDEVGDLNEDVMARMLELCRMEKAVAVGEIGLDYYWDKENHEKQEYWFRRQIALAREEKLPMIIHSREAAADTLRVMKEEKSEETRMKEVKSPKKPLLYYYGIVLLIIIVFNVLVTPMLTKTMVKEVDYGTFMSKIEDKKIDDVQIEDNQILFTDKDDKNNNDNKNNADNNATDNENMTDDAVIDNGDTVSEGTEGAGTTDNTTDGTTAEDGTVAQDLGDGVRAVGDGVGDAVEDVGDAVGDAVDGRE